MDRCKWYVYRAPKNGVASDSIPELSYYEAMELSHFGAKVIYPPTLQPLVEKIFLPISKTLLRQLHPAP